MRVYTAVPIRADVPLRNYSHSPTLIVSYQMARLCSLSHVSSFVQVYFLVLVVSSVASASTID